MVADGPAVQVAVVAGGAGSRMRARLGDTPKVIAPVGDRPFLAVLLAELDRLGTDRVHLCLGLQAETVLDAVVPYVPAGMTVGWTVEPEPLGVLGALAHARTRLQPAFVLLYGDVLPQVRPDALEARRVAAGRPAAMLTWRVRDGRHLPNAALGDGLVTRYAKGEPGLEHLDAGMVSIRRDLLDVVPDGQCVEEGALFAQLAASRRLAALQTDLRPLQVGDPEGYDEVLALHAGEVRACR